MTDGTKIFQWGRHKNRTYEEIYLKDKQFCELVLQENGIHKPKSEEFRLFLLSKISTVEERSCKFFLGALLPHVRAEFASLVGFPEIQVKKVHNTSQVLPNGFRGVFYKLFAKKCITNFNNTDCYSKYVSKYNEIFPFKVSTSVPKIGCEILKHFDNNIMDEIKSFINAHFDDINNQEVCELFLSNIYNFRLAALKEIISLECPLKISQILCMKDFPRLNIEGAKKYLSMYNDYDEIIKMFKHATHVKATNYTLRYFLGLPELNFRELYSLLDFDFLKQNPKMYQNCFKKYLFFFINALRSKTKPVFFIDDVLYECLKSWRTYVKSRQNIFQILNNVALLTLVHRRKQPLDKNDGVMDLKNLIDVKNYFEHFPHISSALVDYEVKTDSLESSVMALVGDTCLNMCYSKKRRNRISEFYRAVCFAALHARKIRRLVIYNAYFGEEYSVDMPDIEDEVRNFIKKYNKYDFSQELPAEKFITWGSEKYFYN